MEELEGWGHPPSQPSNFLTILHLRQRWLALNHPTQQRKLQEKPQDANPSLLHNPPLLATSWSTSRRSRKSPAYYRAVPVITRPCNQSVDEPEPLLLVQSSDEKKTESKNKKMQKPRSQSDDVGGESLITDSSIESDEKKKPGSLSEGVGEAVLAVSSVESEEKKNKKSMKKKKPRSPSEDVGEALLAVSPLESDEKKKQSMKKPLVEKKPRSQSEEDEGEALLADPPIKSDDKKKKSKSNRHPKKPVDRTSRTPEENLEEMSKIECEIAKRDKKKDVRTSTSPEVNLKKGMQGKEREKKYVWARKIDEKKGDETLCGSGTANTNAMKEIESKLSRISVRFESKRGTNNGVYYGSSQGNRNIGGHRNLHRSAPRKQIDAGMIWVRKDELPIGA